MRFVLLLLTILSFGLNESTAHACMYDPCLPLQNLRNDSISYLSDVKLSKNLNLLIEAYYPNERHSNLPLDKDITSFQTFESLVVKTFERLSLEAPKLEEKFLYEVDSVQPLVAFLDALQTEPDLKPYYGELLLARYKIVNLDEKDFENVKASLTPKNSTNKLSEFYLYIQAALVFYRDREEGSKNSLPLFQSLTYAKASWIKEAALYMTCRIDKTQCPMYLQAYPAGRFANSILDYERFFALQDGDSQRLERLLLEGFQRKLQNRQFFQLLEMVPEISAHFPSNKIPWQQPMLAAGLFFSKKNADGKDLEGLQQSIKSYEPYPGLFDLLTVKSQYELKRYQQVIKTPVPEGPAVIRRTFRVIQAYSLKAVGNFDQAISVLKQIRKENPQDLALDKVLKDFLVQKKDFAGLMKDGHHDSQPSLVEEYLRIYPTDEELAFALRHESLDPKARVIAQDILLKRLLLTKRYQEFLKLYQESGKPEIFQKVETAVKTLMADATNSKGLLNVGYFLQDSNLNVNSVYKDCCVCAQASEPLPHGQESYLNQIDPPFRYYLAALSVVSRLPADSKGEHEDEAKILNFLINCFSQTTLGYRCGASTEETPLIQRKIWFQTLKKKFPKSKWAQQLKYYF